jgi:hypothetical protein
MKSRVAAPVLVLAAALSMMNAARYGWGAATIDGDRVKWGLRSMGRSPLQPTIVVEDFCWWQDGPRGLCTLEPGSEWAAAVFRWASPGARISAAGLVFVAGLLLWRRSLGAALLLAAAIVITAGGVAAVLASQRISIYIANGVSPGWAGSLTWRFAVLLTFAAFALSFRPPALAGAPSPVELRR